MKSFHLGPQLEQTDPECKAEIESLVSAVYLADFSFQKRLPGFGSFTDIRFFASTFGYLNKAL